MRPIEAAASPEVRSACVGNDIGDARADAAFDLAIQWCKQHPLRHAATRHDVQQYHHHLRHAVEVAGRNTNVNGADPMEWFRIVNEVTKRLLDWQLEPLVVLL